MGNRMYSDYFGIRENAFSITPDPRYLYMSERHREAFAHLLYGAVESGGFVQLTGEVGTGKTTICRAVLERLPANVDVALLLNPPATARELLLAILGELRIPLPVASAPLQALVQCLNDKLLESHAAGRRTVVIIDEAQTIKPEILEQVRLLTNLETPTAKLLQVFLIGQPELREMLGQRSLRQVAQRITARYHLEPLTRQETEDYIRHRLTVAGCRQGLFSEAALRQVYQESQGIPRVINILCDRTLLGAFANDKGQVDAALVRYTARLWRGAVPRRRLGRGWWPVFGAGLGVALLAGIVVIAYSSEAIRMVPMASASQVASRALPQREMVVETPPVPMTVAAVELAEPDEEWVVAEDAILPGLDEVLPQLPSGAAALHRAEQLLLQQWEEAARLAEGRSLCEVAARHGLRCGRGVGGIATLRRYDRPALLTLVQPEGASSYATLVAVEGDTLTLLTEQSRVQASVEEVTRHWNGEFLLLWRPPLEGVHLIGADASPDAVLWLRQALDRLEGGTAPDRNKATFDDALQYRLQRFQARHGLRADGVAGVQTLTHLITLLGEPHGPLLTPKPPLS